MAIVRIVYPGAEQRDLLPSTPRGDRRPTQIIVHESVTTSVESTERVLRASNLGVHFMVGPRGEVTQHGDPIRDRMSHAASQNGTSFAIEVVSPYYPELRKEPWADVLPLVGWADKGRDGRRNYLMPTRDQLESVAALIDWATTPQGPIGVPRDWVGLQGGRFALNRVKGVDPRTPGIWAHTYTAHADGAVPVLYAWLRVGVGLSAGVAYAECVRLASTRGRWADVAGIAPRPSC